MKKVLIVIDMQNDFVTGSLGSEMAQAIVPNILEKLKKAKEERSIILFTRDTHEVNYLETLEGKNLPVEHCIRGTEGWEIIPEFKEYTFVTSRSTNMVNKPTFGSIYLPTMIPNEFEEIEICGVCTDICVVSNALMLRAKYPNARIIVDSNACVGTSVEAHESALTVMRSCQIEVK